MTIRESDKPIVVVKFGGTSLEDSFRIKSAADRVITLRRQGYHLVVVVSAMAGETNRLLDLAFEFGSAANEERKREFDALISTGEQVSSALMAMALQEKGTSACSLNASQIKVHADRRFQSARIKSIDSMSLFATLESGSVAVVTGFQGVDKTGNIVTLGRGGSDTSCVAFAVALGAEKCEIYTDVEGVFTADPRIFPKAKKLDTIFFEEMMELASSGARVLQIRSVELAMKNNMTIHVRSGFSDKEGTLVVSENNDMEKLVVTGIAHDDHQAKLTVVGLENRPDILARVLEPIALADISIDLITQNIGIDGKMTVSFSLDESNLEHARTCIMSHLQQLGSPELYIKTGLVKVSVVGVGMRNHAGVAQKVFAILSSKQIPILMGLSTEIKVSCVIPAEYRDIGVSVLHCGFDLDQIGLKIM